MTMREILFRGKRADNGKWTTGTPFFVKGRCKMIHAVAVHPDFLDEGNVYYSEGYPVIDDTIGQFTGLTDKNGTKIFEGDIVRAVLPKSNAIPEFVWPDMVVGFSEGAFSAMRGRYCTPLYSFAPAVELEVIGNIHENPELMEGEHHG